MVRCHFRNLDDIEVQLRWLAGQPDRCIVRGAIASGKNVELDVPRWLHARDNGPATIAEAPMVVAEGVGRAGGSAARDASSHRRGRQAPGRGSAPDVGRWQRVPLAVQRFQMVAQNFQE
jgi:hypothetical protein